MIDYPASWSKAAVLGSHDFERKLKLCVVYDRTLSAVCWINLNSYCFLREMLHHVLM